jgi:hypothetical protein
MPTWIRAFKHMGYTTAIAAFTITPLMGFVVGDRRPSVAATALQMFIAVALLSAALVLTLVDEHRRALAIRRRAVALGAARHPFDPFAEARRQAHAAGLPWVEADGSVSRGDV